MSDAATFPCLGFTALGLCHYDPKQPYAVYFTIGDSIAALGFTLAVQQLIKPIYMFRLKAYGLRLSYVMTLVFAGAACTAFASLLPSLPIPSQGPFAYPIVWELLGALVISVAYGAASVIALRHATVTKFNVVPFVRAAASLLSSADDDDRVAVAEDLTSNRNLERLFSYARAWEVARDHEAMIEFERLREAGSELSIRGNAPESAFYRFTHRKELERAALVGTFFRILSDQDMCSALVRRAPWLASYALDLIADKALHSDQAQPFIAELGYQAVLHDDSMLAKEMSYSGFRAVPLLSNSLFGNDFILRHYDPLGRIGFTIPPDLTDGFVNRLNGASLLIVKRIISGREFWPQQRCMFSLRHLYQSLCNRWSSARYRGETHDFAVSIHFGVRDLYTELLKGFENTGRTRLESLYRIDAKRFAPDLVGIIAHIVFESLECIANRFAGFDDDGWTHAIDTIMQLFPSIGVSPEGMNPLQQQLAVLLIDKLKNNMIGFYPALSRILLACVGPHRSVPPIQGRTAYVILKDAMYTELKRLRELHAQKPEKVGDFLPNNVIYDPELNTLKHFYRGGDTVVTELDAIEIGNCDLFDQSNWQTSRIHQP